MLTGFIHHPQVHQQLEVHVDSSVSKTITRYVAFADHYNIGMGELVSLDQCYCNRTINVKSENKTTADFSRV